MEVKQDRATRLFSYLRVLAQLRTKTVRDCHNYEQVLWFRDIPREPGCSTMVWGSDDETSDDVWIEIKRRREPKLPKIPEICLNWVELETVYNSDLEPDDLLDKLRDRIIAPEEELDEFREDSAFEEENYREPVFLNRSDFPEVDEAWLEYIDNEWEPWAEKHRRWKLVQRVYSELFSMYQQQKRLGEDYELVLGLGLLVWTTPSNQRVRRHLLVGQASVELDPDKGEIKVERSAEGTRLSLESDMLELSERPQADLEKELEKLAEQASAAPFAREKVDPIIRSWVQSVSSEGGYIEDLEPPTEFKPNPQVSFAPAIILRKRTARTLVRSYSTIIDQIEQSGEVPIGVQRFCEIMEDDYRSDDSDPYPGIESHEDRDNGKIYFPLPVNEEQRRIIEELGTRQGVLVQGPPGTGKSHTIANLICHLLATGKRILITSQTPRALKVLAGMLPQDIAPLCVSVLGSDASAMDNLERSVRGITDRYQYWNRAENEREIVRLEKEVDELKRAQADIDRRLRELREVETYKHHVAGGVYQGTAQEIAIVLAYEAPTHGWFPDDIDEAVDMPFDATTFNHLLRLLREISDKRIEELRQPIVPSQELPTIEDFIKIVGEERSAAEVLSHHEERKSSSSFALLAGADKSLRSEVKRALQNLYTAVRSTEKRKEPWISRAVSGILTDHDLPWKELRSTTVQHLQGLRERAQKAEARELSLPDSRDRIQVREDARTLLEHIEKKGKIGPWIFQKKEIKKTRYLTEQVRVNGRLCNDAATLSELIATFDVEQSLERLWKAWGGLARRVKGPYPFQVSTIEEHLEALDIVLDLEEPLQKAKVVVDKIEGLPEPVWDDFSTIRDLLDDIEAVEANESHASVKATIDSYLHHVKTFAANPKSHTVNLRAVNALERRDENTWGEIIDELTKLEDDRHKLERRTELLNRLAEVAPRLAEVLSRSPLETFWDERISRINEAWAWKQADIWLRRFWEEHQQEQLEVEYETNRKKLEKATANLASARAWSFCFERMSEEHRTHLIAWMKAVQKFGKGKSKYIEKYRRDAQKNMEACRGAIPAWVMPFYRVVETIDPEPNMFDVVIIDEASQSGPDALLLMYLAKQCIVVGDDQQISPEAVGINLADVNLLMERYLKDIPISERFGPESSLFSLGEIRYPGRIPLREHFRCMPEIIHFSNALCYPSVPLIPLRQYPPERLEPIICFYVPDGYREGRSTHPINPPEADAIADAIVECCNNPAYADKTMGVISLQGDAQARLVESLLLERIGPEEFENRHLICGNPYAFQGDERDVIFLSLVAAPGVRIGPLTKESDKRRFNVAASRARDQVWLFHTATLNDLNKDCMRYKLLDYYQNPQPIIDEEIDPSVFESQFEQDVFDCIHSLGYRVIPQFKLGKYRVDLVVEGMETRLAVECDGDAYHPPDKYYDDMVRQRTLERCGMVFWRVRGSTFYRDPNAALEPLWKKLEEMKIYPRREDPGADEPPCIEDEPSDSHEAGDTESESQDDEVEVTTGVSERSHFKDATLNNPELWEEMIEWGEETNSLTQLEINEIVNVIKVMEDDWYLTPKQVASAEEIAEKAFSLGFRFTNGEENQVNQSTVTDKDSQEDKPAVKTEPKQPHEPDDDVAWVSAISAKNWLALSRWAKKQGHFRPWERSLLYDVGKRLKYGSEATPRQARQARRLMEEARELGFLEL